MGSVQLSIFFSDHLYRGIDLLFKTAHFNGIQTRLQQSDI